MTDAAAVVISAPKSRARRNVYLTVGSVLLGTFAWRWRFSAGRWRAYDPNAQDLLALLDPPSASHWFGADQVGRDIPPKISFGTRTTLMVAADIGRNCRGHGCYPGLAGRYYGGVTDRLITVTTDLLLTVPSMVLAIAIVSPLG